MTLPFIFYLEYFHVSALPHISHSYPHIYFCLPFQSARPQMPVLQISMKLSEVIVVERTIPETVALPLSYIVVQSKEDTAQKLLLYIYHFINQFWSTTPYLPIFCPIFTTTSPQGLIDLFSYMTKMLKKVELCWSLLSICSKK